MLDWLITSLVLFFGLTFFQYKFHHRSVLWDMEHLYVIETSKGRANYL